MNSETLTTLSHHAYVLVGTTDVYEGLLKVLVTHHSISPQANPDFFDRAYEVFTIDDARELKTFHETRPYGPSGKKIIIVRAHSVTSEAQNALLKVLEEPAEYAHFFMIIPSVHTILPTVLSRVLLVSYESAQNSRDTTTSIAEARSFIALSVPKRLEMIKKLVEDISKEKKTKQDAIDFLNAIQSVVYQKQGPVKGRAVLQTIEKAREYMTDRAPSVKMLLEYVALQV